MTAISALVMYRRLRTAPDSAQRLPDGLAQPGPESPGSAALLLTLPPEMDRRLANLAYDLDLTREQAGLRALETYLAREDQLREELSDA